MLPFAGEPRRPTGRPTPSEYADYASGDIAAVPGDDAIDALAQLAEQTPAIFRALADAAEGGLTYAEGKWTLKELLGHLIDDERIFAYRLLCLARGEDRELPGFDENRYAACAEFSRRSLEDLVAEYSATRAATLALLRGLPPAAWSQSGRVNGYACTVRGLAFHIAGHELHHHRIVRERYVPLLAERVLPHQLGASTMPRQLYVVVEHFKNGDASPVYRRFREHGRLAPPGLTYISSWVDVNLQHCYQLMETDNPRLVDEWIGRWNDLVDFEVHRVMTSAAAADAIGSRQ